MTKKVSLPIKVLSAAVSSITTASYVARNTGRTVTGIIKSIKQLPAKHRAKDAITLKHPTHLCMDIETGELMYKQIKRHKQLWFQRKLELCFYISVPLTIEHYHNLAIYMKPAAYELQTLWSVNNSIKLDDKIEGGWDFLHGIYHWIADNADECIKVDATPAE